MLSISNLIHKNNYLRFFQLVLLLWVLSLQSLLAVEKDIQFGKGILFKLEKHEYPTSFVLGTIHSGDSRVLDISEKTQTALAAAQQYVMEVVLDGESIFTSLGNMWLLEGKKLSQVIGDELYAEVLKAGNQTGMPEAAFTYMKPWVVMMIFSLPPGDYANILDIRLMKLALVQNKKVIGLETANEQFNVFDGMSLEDQVLLLKHTLKNYPELTIQFERLLQAYLERDLQKLQAIGEEQVEQADRALYDRLMKRLVDDRNNKMVKRLLPYLKNKSSFVAIGALHLSGAKGLLSLLQQQGFTVTRIE